jgi:hypothetical protein
MDPCQLTDQFLATTPIEVLAQAVSVPGGYVEMAGCRTRFTCPRCHHHDHNGGSAEIRSSWLWWCSQCRNEGTIHELRRVALETPTAIRTLLAGSR